MLQEDLLDLINNTRAWAFVGAGASMASGCPDWRGLLTAVVGRTEERARVEGNRAYQKALKQQRFPAAFAVIEEAVGRETLERLVRRELQRHDSPSDFTRILAQWPFAGYITTNYDGLLEKALGQLDPGWASIGNTEFEARKLSGGVDHVVWHLHGSIDPGVTSRLILTEGDYDSLYLHRHMPQVP